MDNTPENSKEIDITQIAKHMRRYYQRTGNSFYNFVLFLKRNAIIIAILIIGGGVLGYFLDKGPKGYQNKILVTPNFNSADYLYEKVELLNNKILEKDTVFLKSLGIKNTKKLGKIDVEPVTDLYGFLNENENLFTDRQNDIKLEVFQIMAEKGNLDKVIEDEALAKNYKYHLITISSSRETSHEKTTRPILDFLNDSPYFAEAQKEYIKSVDQAIAENDSTILQINNIMKDYTANRSSSSVYYNDNTDIARLVQNKSVLLEKQKLNRIDKVNYTRIIKDNAILLNVDKVGITSGRMKIILPLLFFFIFILLMRFKNFYKRHTQKRKAAVTLPPAEA